MNEALRELVWQRAEARCEYWCLTPGLDVFPLQIDHVIALKHHGLETADNLALSCYHCNLHKGPNIAGFDVSTRTSVRLFNPRQDLWRQLFRWDGARLLGLTAIGSVTVDVLNINLPERLEHRRLLIAAGVLILTP